MDVGAGAKCDGLKADVSEGYDEMSQDRIKHLGHSFIHFFMP